jgi:hypothetical protein
VAPRLGLIEIKQKGMIMKNITKLARLSAALIVGTAVLISGCATAPGGEPEVDISPYRHGNLASAQELIRGAYDRLGDAQVANNDELGGHAARAKELLREAADEVKLAAIAANRR